MFGGGIRTMNFVRCFRDLGSVDLMCKSPPSSARAPGIFRKEWFLPGSYHSGDKRRGRLNARLQRLIHASPWILNESSLDTKSRFLSILLTEKYDVVLVRYLHNTSFIFDLPAKYRKRVIVDYDDIVSDSLFGVYHGEATGFYLKFRLQLEKRILKKYEQKCLTLGAALFCSEEDRKRISGPKGRGNTHVVPNIYENPSFRQFDFGNGFRNLESILFVGTLDYRPNIEGLTWFLEKIYPAIMAKFPKAYLTIAGRYSSNPGLLGDFPGVKFFPNAPDLKPLYRDCGAVVVPVLSGGGTRIKILEAAFANRPVLTTPLGAYGLGLVDGRDALFFNDRETFVAAYGRLFEKVFYDSLVRHLRDLVLSNYSRSHFHEAMRRVIAGIPGAEVKAGAGPKRSPVGCNLGL
jgi:glycosyltransferase involved in cell wall biosynthesis